MDFLRIGSKGPDVEQIQRQLKQWKFDPGAVDGRFGPKTEAAIRAFQDSREDKDDIEVDGVVGPRTQGRLSALKQGFRGSEVTELQEELRKRGFYSGKEPDFGRETEEAVRQFQESEGIFADGIAGSRTRATLGLTADVEQWKDVFAEEQRVIDLRRASRGQKKNDDFVGLAFSGGGIRSATFGLGVLEGMKDLGLLERIDYLSTVSGGGYIGGWLSASCRRAKDAGADWLARTQDWTRSIAHLRRYSNYLSPEVGFFSADTWSMAAVWMRNTLLVQLTIIAFVALVLLVPRPLLEGFVAWPGVGDWRWVSVVVFVVAVAGIAGNQLRAGTSEQIFMLQARSWPHGLAAGGACVALILAACICGGFDPFTKGEVDHGTAFVVAGLTVAAGFFFLAPGVQLVNKLSRSPEPPQRVDYTQAWVQCLVVFPLLATGYLVAAVMWGQLVDYDSPFKGTDTYGGFLDKERRFWPFPLQIALVALWLLSFCSVQLRGLAWKKSLRNFFVALFAPLPSIGVLYLLICAIMLLMSGWTADPERGQWLAFVWAPSLVLFAFTLAIVMLIGALGRQSSESCREWWSRLGAWLAIYGVSWMLVSIAAVYGPLWAAAMLDGEFWKNLAAVGGWIGTTVAGLLAGNSSSTGTDSGTGEARKSPADKAKEAIALLAPFVFIAGLLVGVSTALHLVILNFSAYGDLWSLKDLHDRHWLYMSMQPLGVVAFAIAATAFVTWFLSWRVDINEFSLNAFYRSRLCRCYLGATRLPDDRKPQNFTEFDEADDLALPKLLRKGAPDGPFHIVNCALNLGGSSDLELHTRHSASFTLTPLAVGTDYGRVDRIEVARRAGAGFDARNDKEPKDRIGYQWTSAYGGRNGQPTLAQAVSVSGAAASPNMGYHTSPVVAFMLTMFNARLGWWFPNPQKRVEEPSPRSNLKYLLSELFGIADDKSNFLMISDGGHFENLAAYELIKRKCRVIVVSDGECDPGLKFEGLGTLIRMCEVDGLARIDIKVGSIRRGSGSQWSTARCAVGRITYPNDPRPAYLIYLKASMTGHEDSSILQYKAAHPAFPHESTGDQFYAEDQFESYRALGREIAEQTFKPLFQESKPAARSVATPSEWERWAGLLFEYFAPALKNAGQFTRHSDQLMELWSRLASDPKVEVFDAAFEQKLDVDPWFRQEYFTCSRMLQLMENVYLDLDLENTWEHPDNAGWRATFERWAQSPAIQKAWELSGATYGKRFQYFCERRLKFKLP